MMTKSENRLIQHFVSNITRKYSLNGAGNKIGMHQAQSYRSSRNLVKRRLIIADENGLFGLNYKENHFDLVTVEYQRTSEFLSKPRHKNLARFINEINKTLDIDNFIFLLFGSSVEKANPRDYDILLLIESVKNVDKYEKIITNLADNYPSLEVEIVVDSFNGFRQMLRKRDKKNVINEALNKHLLFYGADSFYRILSRERPYDDR